MVSNTKKTFSLYLGYLQENRDVTAKKNEYFCRAKVLSNIYGKSDKISIFRNKSDGAIKFRSRDSMKHVF